MKIVLINPPLSLEERYGTLASSGTQTPPLGIAILAAVLRQRGFQPFLIDAPAQGMDMFEIIQTLDKIEASYIGITVTCVSVHRAGELALRIKQVFPKKTVIVGGPQLPAMPQETLKDYPDFDIGVVGEGEKTLVELLNCLLVGDNLEEIKGLALRKDGQVILTPKREYISDLDTIPFPAWDLLPQPLAKVYYPAALSARKFPAFPLVTSRGCPSKCIFCDRAVFGNIPRAHSERYVFEMMRWLYTQYGIREFAIVDDTFNLFKLRLKRLCRMIINSPLKISWTCNARIDCVDQEGLVLMKKSGCWQIAYGLETGCQKILDIIQKRQEIEKVKAVVKLTKKTGIRVKGFFMFGCPGETEETMQKTIDFVREIDIDDFQLTYFTPLPGSEVFKEAEKYGQFNRNLAKMNYWQALFIPYGLTKERLDFYYRLAYKKFYFRFKTVVSYLKLIRSVKHLFRLLKGAILLATLVWAPKIKRATFSQREYWNKPKLRIRSADNKIMESVYRPRCEFLKSILNLHYSQAKFLDVGCGNGALSFYLQDNFFTVGLDFSAAMLRFNPCRNLVQAKAEDMPFRDASFDVVACSALLHHLTVNQMLKVIFEMCRVSKKYIVFYEPNRNNPAMFLFGLLNREEWGTLRFSRKYLEGVVTKARLITLTCFTSELIAPYKCPFWLYPLFKKLNQSRFLNRILGLTHCLIAIKP